MIHSLALNILPALLAIAALGLARSAAAADRTCARQQIVVRAGQTAPRRAPPHSATAHSSAGDRT